MICLKEHTHKTVVGHSTNQKTDGKQKKTDGGQPSNRRPYSVGCIADHVHDVSLNLDVGRGGTLHILLDSSDISILKGKKNWKGQPL